MLILGLDPGSRATGYALVESSGSRLWARAHGCLRVSPKEPLALRLASLGRQLEELLARWPIEVAVLETPFHGLNVRSLIVLAQARGTLLATLGSRGLDVVEYSPAEIKGAVTGNGRADKQQVARMVAALLALEQEPEGFDATDALAVAICYAHRYRMDRIGREGD